MELHKTQQIVASSKKRYRVVNCGRQWGKALDIKTRIPTKQGWKTMEEVLVGDVLFDEYGDYTKVTYVTDIQHNRECYEVEFSDGIKIVADAEHLWKVADKSYRKNTKRTKNTPIQQKVLDTKTLQRSLKYGKDNNYSIINTKPIKGTDKKLPIDPYVLGLWLGDGGTKHASFSTADNELLEVFVSKGYTIGSQRDKYTYGIKGLRKQLRLNNLLGNKHIPQNYLRASLRQRLELLKGLMDTDGTISKDRYNCEYVTKLEVLKDGFVDLVTSFGIKAHITKKKAMDRYYYRIRFTPTLNVFKLERKKALYKKPQTDKPYQRYIVSIKQTQSTPVKCIQVDSPNSLYLVEGYIPTHNTHLSCEEIRGRSYYLDNQNITYFATTRDQARNIAWHNLQDMTRALWAKKPNETLLELYIRNQYGNISTVTLRGFENVETARVTQIDFIILDEVASMPRFKYAWEAILQPTLLYRKGDAMFISTPKGYNHFNELYLKEKTSPEWESFTYTTYDNPFIDKQEVENIRQQVTTDYFNQEYLAQFTRFTGLIYKEFDQSVHVDWFDHEFNSHAEYLFGLDFAVRGYTAAVCAKLMPDGHVYILDEYKVDNDTAVNHGNRIKEMLLKYADIERWTGYADPAGWIKNQQRNGLTWSLADEYLELGLPISQANNEVVASINYGRQLLQANKIHIHIRCTKLVNEIMQYQWKDQPDKQVGMKNAPEEVRKVNDHLIDAGMRYMIYSKSTPPDEQRPYAAGMPIVFQMKFDPQEEKKSNSIFNTDLY